MLSAENGFRVPVQERYFEDYRPGLVCHSESEYVHEEEVVGFAQRFDPQWIHTDPAAAAKGPFDGLIASGWHTASLMMRMFVLSYLNEHASIGGAGVQDLRWLSPVRPGDRLSAKFTVLKARRSKSKPDRGLVHTGIEVFREDGDVVMTLTTISMLRVKPATPS
jgi:acyl dehydratase